MIFLYVHKFILSKLNRTSNSMICTSKYELEWVSPFDFNTKYHTHPNKLELKALSFPSWNGCHPLVFHCNHFHAPIQCIQTQHKSKGKKKYTFNTYV
jgi:hypothetical protein